MSAELIVEAGLMIAFFILVAVFVIEYKKDLKRGDDKWEKLEEIDRQLIAEMVNDTHFARWADDYGLSAMERDAAWSAWKSAKEPHND